MSFQTALTGVNAATADLGVISNNIANSSTTGFKGSRAEFADLFYGATGVGYGVQMAGVRQQFEQGGINATGNPLDLAINGEGFFRLNDNGSIVYSRAGSFGIDRDGYIVNNDNLRLTGYLADATGNITDTVGDLQLDSKGVDPKSTTAAQYALNLSANAPAIDTAANPFDPTDANSYNFSTSLTVYDSLGISHTLTSYYVKPDATTNDWEVHFTLDGGVPFDTSTTPPTPTQYGPQTLSFDSSGNITGTTTINLTGVVTGNAAANLDLNLDYAKTTQFGGNFSVNALTQDGYASGTLSGVTVGEDGTVFGRYDNGQSRALGRVALANFSNAQGLKPVGHTNWAESFASGAPLIGAPGTGKLGEVHSGALEGSNVDLTKELVNMINAQRNFQANSQVIGTTNEMTQTIINLR
ncbi:MAG: flagellar hook protein FlgE [Gammaproteobacteria bacterium]